MKKEKIRKKEIEYCIAVLNDLVNDTKIHTTLIDMLERGEPLSEDQRKALSEANWALPRLGIVISLMMVPGELRRFFLDHPEARSGIVEDMLKKANENKPENPMLSVRQAFEAIKATKPEAVIN